MNQTDGKRPRGTRWCAIGSWLAGIGLLLAAAGILGARLGLLSPIGAFMTYGIGALLALLAGLLLVVGLLLSRGSGGAVAAGRAWAALAVSAILIAVSLTQRPAVDGAPPIHDISTDLVEPPAFSETLRAAREADGAQNPVDHPGAETAAVQAAAFPDLKTLVLEAPPATVFAAALAVARELGWEIVTSDAAAGRIEATATTRWFRFRDDVLIRIRPQGSGSAIDVRSKSRVGRGDMGANATRIREFLKRLQAAVG